MDKKIKITHILSKMDIGGLENGVVSICNGLNRELFQPSICCVKGGGAMLQRLSSDIHVDILNCKEGKSPLRLYQMLRSLKRQNPDIVHTHAWGQCSFEGILGAKLSGIPIVINGEHGLFFKKWHQKFIQRILSLFCNNILSVSTSLKKEVNKELGIPLHRITAIYNGVDTDKFNGQYDNSKIIEEINNNYGLTLGQNTFIIGSIGSLKAIKNQQMLIEAMNIITNGNNGKNNICVLIVGNGPDQKALEALSEHYNLKNKVAFIGTRRDIPQLLSLMHVVVSTSISEGLSNVLLESMASGVPVIATDCDGSLEIIENELNGFIVPKKSVQSLAELLIGLSQNPNKAAAIGQNARRFIEKYFSLYKMVSDYETLYQKLYKRLKN
jgi:sugar transferase (PEP-CTERM/EpsH1 system associated)